MKRDRTEYMKLYYEKNKERKKAQSRDYYNRNKEKRSEYNKLYYIKNRESRLQQVVEYCTKRRKEDPLYKLKGNIRSRIVKFFEGRGIHKNSKTEEMLGCSWLEAKEHLEKQFEDGMTWENHGEWHIDHKKPLTLATTEKEAIELCRYTNLQPLWAIDNLIKSSNY